MRRALLIVGVGLIALAAITAVLVSWSQRRGPERWEATIRAYEEADAERPPQPGAIVFVGSSSFRLWESLAEDMAPLYVLNRGFGGSQLSDAVHYAERIVTPYRPRAVVLYEGDNDLARPGKTAVTVLEDFRMFVAIVHAAVPEARIYFVSIKPSPRRWERWGEMRRANALIETFTGTDARLATIDIAPALLGPEGRPRAELFRLDGLHLNAAGYAAWTAVIKPILERDLGGP